MIKNIHIRLSPEGVTDSAAIKETCAEKLNLFVEDISETRVVRRSLDARGKNPVFDLQVAVSVGEPLDRVAPETVYTPVKNGRTIIVVGSGPAGLFAALRLIELGMTPIILERGKDVTQRRFDLKTINTDGICHPDSNYCFGEGGAGTYSDGKLYTRSTKRGNVKKFLSILVQHGADPDILIDAHPHIGSNRLPKIIQSIRKTILECNGQFHFNERVSDLILKDNRLIGVRTLDREFVGDAVILATGHSARDIYTLLDRHQIQLEAKPFAMGIRVEHPQELINSIQYGRHAKSSLLPPATYSLVCQVGKRGVFSFCMCPGGMLVPAATAPGELVLNGMSNAQRNLPFANAGIVVTIDETLYKPNEQPSHFTGLEFQKSLEKKAFEAGGKSMAAPAQRLTDFLENRLSSTLPKTSYIPGVVNFSVKDVLGDPITVALQSGFHQFEKRMKGFITREALVLAVESRTSAPVRIPRTGQTRMHPVIKGLFPVGEGAGYAGGIVSSALDGEAGADAAAAFAIQP